MRRRAFLQLLGAAAVAKPVIAAVIEAPKVQEIDTPERTFVCSGESWCYHGWIETTSAGDGCVSFIPGIQRRSR